MLFEYLVKNLLATTVLTVALAAGTNAGAAQTGPVLLTDTQLDTVDAGRRHGRRHRGHSRNRSHNINRSGNKNRVKVVVKVRGNNNRVVTNICQGVCL